jgi:hypothetical protein
MESVVLPPSRVDRAALAFSLLSTTCAAKVNRRLSISERMRLREGLTRVKEAPDEQRHAAVLLLAREVKRGLDWPRPSAHDDKDCPFHVVLSHPRSSVVEIFERMVQRDPMKIAVTLCHLPADARAELWAEMSKESQGPIRSALDDVHGVSTIATREMARDLTSRLGRAIRQTGRAPLVLEPRPRASAPLVGCAARIATAGPK